MNIFDELIGDTKFKVDHLTGNEYMMIADMLIVKIAGLCLIFDVDFLDKLSKYRVVVITTKPHRVILFNIGNCKYYDVIDVIIGNSVSDRRITHINGNEFDFQKSNLKIEYRRSFKIMRCVYLYQAHVRCRGQDHRGPVNAFNSDEHSERMAYFITSTYIHLIRTKLFNEKSSIDDVIRATERKFGKVDSIDVYDEAIKTASNQFDAMESKIKRTFGL